MSKLNLGINGLGRIGRLVLRQGFDSLNIKALSGRSSLEVTAHLLKYDSVHGLWDKEIEVKNQTLVIEGRAIPYFQASDPSQIPWDKQAVDVVAECTGAFKKREDLQKHLKGSVKKVIVSAPAEGADVTLVYGVNHLDYKEDKHHLVSLASCTTNCLAPLVKILHAAFTIERGSMTTVHSYTKDQRILDSSHKDLRRARASGLNLIPTTTGAAKALEILFPELKDCIQGFAIRVPVSNVSLLDLVLQIKKETTVEEVNAILKKESKGLFKDILAVEEKPLVSTDFNGRRESSIVDSLSTQVVQGHLVKVLSWYDNECGFSQRIIDFIHFLEK